MANKKYSQTTSAYDITLDYNTVICPVGFHALFIVCKDLAFVLKSFFS